MTLKEAVSLHCYFFEILDLLKLSKNHRDNASFTILPCWSIVTLAKW